jgi:hypothetical protein
MGTKSGVKITKDGKFVFSFSSSDLNEPPTTVENMDSKQREFLAAHGFVNDAVTSELDGLNPTIRALREAGLELEEHADGDLTINGRRVRFVGRN